MMKIGCLFVPAVMLMLEELVDNDVVTRLDPPAILEKYDHVKQLALRDMDLDVKLRSIPISVVEESPSDPIPTPPPSNQQPEEPTNFTPTPSAQYMSQMTGLAVEQFSINADSYHLFMQTRHLHHWVVRLTNFTTAAMEWRVVASRENAKSDNILMNIQHPYYDTIFFILFIFP